MRQKISFDGFLSQLSLKSDITPQELEGIVFDLFAQVRLNTENGSWVEIEGFGSFHPLWYEIKKHKKQKKITIAKYLLLVFASLAIIFLLLIVGNDETIVSQNKHSMIKELPKEPYKCFTNIEQNQTETSEKFYHYTVLTGDSLYTISNLLYGDSKYWPLIYVENMTKIEDVDNIYPNDLLEIPRIPKSSSALKELSIVYIQAYKAYKRQGKDNKAHWLLYWVSQNINSDLLDTFSEDIVSNDSEKVKEYIKRFSAK